MLTILTGNCLQIYLRPSAARGGRKGWGKMKDAFGGEGYSRSYVLFDIKHKGTNHFFLQLKRLGWLILWKVAY